MGTGAELIAYFAIASAVVGTAATVYSGIQQGAAAKKQANFQAQIAAQNAEIQRQNAAQAKRNADLSRQNAALAEQQAAKTQADQVRRTRSVIGSQIAGVAANGLLVDEGSSVDLQTSTASLGAMAGQEIVDQGARTALGYRIRAEDYDMSSKQLLMAADTGMQTADFYRDAGNDAASAGLISAIGSGIGGAGRAFNQYADMSRTGKAFSPSTVSIS